MRQSVIAAVLSVVSLSVLSIAASAAKRATQRDPRYERIAGAALHRGDAYRFLQTLTETIGPRLTGSEQSRAAADLLVKTLSAAGFENVHVEEYPLRSRWRRGTAYARIVAPTSMPVLVQSFGWAPGTNGSIDALIVDAGSITSTSTLPDVSVHPIVLADFPGDRTEPGYVTRGRTARRLAAAGARALVVPSDKPDRLLDIGCFGNYPAAALPMLSIAREDSLMVRRLLEQGPVRLSLEVTNTLDTTPTVERNVVAELKGTALPDRVVLLGAHFDSWDTATGANDDGSGTAAILEAGRILKSLDLRGRRTIRLVFFSGEEQAILGSHAYVDAHDAELDRIDAVAIMDEGAGVPKGFRLHGRTDLEPRLRQILQPLEGLDARGLSQEASFDQDHSYFVVAGVPALTLWVDPGAYETHHHAITDTIDKIDRRTLAIDTAVMATAALALADAEAIGARLTPAERADLLARTGLDKSATALAEPLLSSAGR
jgi:carboxypeptidase Q